MAETYDITYDGAPVGTARMEKQGLYYLFSCRCRLPDDGLYRIHVRCGETREDLGICVPFADAFGMDKKIAAKRLGVGTPVFELLPKDWKPQDIVMAPEPVTEEIPQEDEERAEEIPQEEENPAEVIPPEEETEPCEPDEDIFIPVSEEEPFEYLDKLEDAVLEEQDGQLGITILDTSD